MIMEYTRLDFLHSLVSHVRRCKSCLEIFTEGQSEFCSPYCTHNFINYKIRYGHTLAPDSTTKVPMPTCLLCGSIKSVNYEYLWPPYFFEVDIDNPVIAICKTCSLLKLEVEELQVLKTALEEDKI